MRRTAAAIAIVLGVALMACRPSAIVRGSSSADVDDLDSYAVYATLLPNESIVKDTRASVLVVQKETATRWDIFPEGKPLEGEWKSVVEAFKDANRSVRTLVTGHDLGRPYVVVPRGDIESIFKQALGDGRAFFHQYPNSGGYLMFSAVGFDADKRRAMVYIAHWCGGLCGGGMHHFLEKVNDRWREVTIPGVTQHIWIS